MNELSAALKRKFNYVYIPIVGDHNTEVKIVQQRADELLSRHNLPGRISPAVIDLLATVFREIRTGKTSDRVSLKKPTTTLSTAEAIGVALDAALHARFFGQGEVGPADSAGNMVGAVVKEDQDDWAALKETLPWWRRSGGRARRRGKSSTTPWSRWPACCRGPTLRGSTGRSSPGPHAARRTVP